MDKPVLSENQSAIPRQSREVKGMFEGPILKLLLRLGLPMLAGMSFQLIYSITDVIWISRIDLEDPSYMGGVGLIFPVLFFAMAIANGIMVGVSSLVARSIGSKNYRTLNRTAESGLVIAVFFCLLLLVIFLLFGKPITRMLGAEGSYFQHAVEYLYFILPAGICIFIGMVFTGILQGEGLMKKVMVAMIIGTGGNILLDPLFIFTLGLKVKGAALATGVAQCFSLVYLLGVFIRKKSTVQIVWKLANINWPVIREIIAVGLPQTTSQMASALSLFLFNTIIINIDPHALTAITQVGSIDPFVLLPLFAMGSVLVTMVGQNYGRKNIQRIRYIWRTVFLSTLLIIILLSGIMVLAAPCIFPFFSKIESVVNYAVLHVRIVTFSFLFTALGILARSFFQAVGKPIPALLVPLFRKLIIAVPAVLIYMFLLKSGIYGIWFGMVTGNIISGIIGLVWVNKSIKTMHHIAVCANMKDMDF